jgi:hypothetical protein
MKAPSWRTLLWLLPLAFCCWLHQYGLRSWFWSDDFAWLSLHLQVVDRQSFLRIMFEPLAQGTIRPWSERGFFLLFYKLFGLDALPYHVLAMATQFANLLLLGWLIRKLGGSFLAALLAPILWTANASLVKPLGWASDYNQILCTFFLLSAFALYLSGRYWLQFAVFVIGFGALEINIVYPAILLAWLLLNKKDWKPALPLFAVSAVYYLVHRWFAPPMVDGPYALHFNLSIFSTLYEYWKLALVPESWYSLRHHPRWFAIFAGSALTAVFWLFAWRIGRTAWFFVAWFLIALAPVLPLRDHITNYYLAIPTIGLASILALGTEIDGPWARSGSPIPRVLLAVPACLYLFMQIPAARLSSRWNFDRSREVRTLVLGTLRAHELHPEQSILLAHITPDEYAFGVAHSPFHAAGFEQAYLSPDTDFSTYPGLVPPSHFVLPAGPTLNGLNSGEIEVYEPAGERIRNITASYRRWARKNISNSVPSRVDAGVPAMAYLLGSTWYPLEGGHRWMPGTATIRIAAPRTTNQKLYITGYCPQDQTRLGPLKVHFLIDGKEVFGEEFLKPEVPFMRIVSVPPELTGRPSMEIGIEVDRTFQGAPGDRPLGLAFGIFEVR